MRDAAPQTIYLSDYKKHDYRISKIDMLFELDPEKTIVTASSIVSHNNETKQDFVLDGEKQKLISASINGKELHKNEYKLNDEQLIIKSKYVPDGEFTLTIISEINPKANTELEGLYLSNGMYCTQCEAQGFRRITYYIDRPDNMAEFFVTIIQDKDKTTPIMLSNGNLLEQGVDDQGRSFAKWHDPFFKPCYLFALVAGDLAVHQDTFTTMSGRNIDLRIYVEHGDEKRCDYAMDSLKRSMKWDEEKYGLEYDLDLFMIVAVSDFNFGAMENKGLNIFNSKYILADPEIATDDDYANIEAIVAHEYFHNWTGNRVTCRDWFQLCLKEGLTVFRDQCFSGDMRSHATKRIDDVINLFSSQFSEDAGPLAHPVRPESYIEINNFYTSTVYEKGAELCRMIHLIVGEDGFRRGCDLYFKRFDGMAVTVEDFVQAMADATRVDLSQFLLWYKQAGTPAIHAHYTYDADKKEFKIALRQETKPTAGQAAKYNMDIPVLTSLIGMDGTFVPFDYNGETKTEHLLRLKDQKQEFVFENIHQNCIPSLLRKFSAPVNLYEYSLSNQDRLHLLAHDNDYYKRYEFGQILAQIIIDKLYKDEDASQEIDAYIKGLRNVILDPKQDNAFKAYMAVLPSIGFLITKRKNIDPLKLYEVRQSLKQDIAKGLQKDFETLYQQLDVKQEYAPTADQAGQRHFKNVILNYLLLGGSKHTEKMSEIYEKTTNMTDKMGILSSLSDHGGDVYLSCMAQFYEKFQNNPHVVDKWFAIQARSSAADVLDNIHTLLKHPAFSYTNPNRARSLLGVFIHGNPVRFHSPEGYQFASEQILKLDKINPKTAARTATAFESVGNLISTLKEAALVELRKIKATPNISKDLFEIVSKIEGGLS